MSAELIRELRDALAEAHSVCNSVSTGFDRKVRRDGSVLYLQTEEWCQWAEDEVEPKVRAAIAAADAAIAQPGPTLVVGLPTTEDEAAAMALVSMAWLKEHAPHRLTPASQPVTAQAVAPEGSEDSQNAARYRKLRGWMSSNVLEGWRQVTELAAIACWVDWGAFDASLDALPDCNVGLMQKPAAPAAPTTDTPNAARGAA